MYSAVGQLCSTVLLSWWHNFHLTLTLSAVQRHPTMLVWHSQNLSLDGIMYGYLSARIWCNSSVKCSEQILQPIKSFLAHTLCTLPEDKIGLEDATAALQCWNVSLRRVVKIPAHTWAWCQCFYIAPTCSSMSLGRSSCSSMVRMALLISSLDSFNLERKHRNITVGAILLTGSY